MVTQQIARFFHYENKKVHQFYLKNEKKGKKVIYTI